MTGSIEKFRIDIEASALADLSRRLAAVRWPDEIIGSDWSLGTSLQYLRSLHAHWTTSYDWNAQQEQLNRLPHFLYEGGGHQVHFIHELGRGPAPIPLLLTHGWPGSFVEMVKIIPWLTDPASHGGNPEDAFTVIVPSIPGHGFSSRPTERGMNVFAIADLWGDLMSALRYERFAVQGGDWGAWISTALGLRHPERLIGLHLNYVSNGFRPDLSSGTRPLSEDEEAYLARVARWREAEGAYVAIQATKPQTLSYGLTDSPIGLAAWLLEKFKGWSDCEIAPEEAIPRDDLLTNIMIYWLTNTINSSLRLYAEARSAPLHLRSGERVLPPCGIVRLPRELPMPPREWAERAFNLVHWTTLPKGGHFAAMEQPRLLAEDIRTFFRPLRRTA